MKRRSVHSLSALRSTVLSSPHRDRVPDRNNCRGRQGQGESSVLGIAEGIQSIMEGRHGSSGNGVHSGRRLKSRYISEDQETESSRTSGLTIILV